MTPARAALAVAASAACFAAIPTFTTLGTRAGAPLMTLMAGRYTLAALLLFAVVVARGGTAPRGGEAPARPPWRAALAIAAVGGVGQALVSYLALSALPLIPAATMVFLFYSYPAWVTLLAAVRRTEPLTGRRLLALALAVAGIVTMVGSPWSTRLDPGGVLRSLAAAVVFAVYIPTVGGLQRGIPATTAAACIAAGTGLLYLVGGAAAGALVPPTGPAAWGAIAGLAVVSTTLAFVLFLRGLAVVGPVRASIISTIEPFCAGVLAWLVLDQPLGAATLAGGALVVSAMVVLEGGKRAER